MRQTLIILLAVLVNGCEFRSPMVASTTGDGKYWVLRESLEYEQPGTRRVYIVPEGFVTDFASVPRLFWVAFPPCDKYTPAAVVHDYLYWAQPANCDRECADGVLLSAMEESDVDYVTRHSIYMAVRAGGQPSWDYNSSAKKQGAIRIIPEPFLDFKPTDTWEQIEARIRKATKRT